MRIHGAGTHIHILFVLPFLLGCASAPSLSPLAHLERRLVFQTKNHEVGTSPVPLDSRFENVWFSSEDGAKLHGYLIRHPSPRAVVLFCHGNSGSVEDWSKAFAKLHDRNDVTVMGFDYRGYGRSEGNPTEQGILQDARAARKTLAERLEIPEREIVVVGQSLGGAVAVDLASQDGARGLVIVSTFSSLPDVASHHVPWALPQWNMTLRLNSAEKIRRYNGPLLQVHGEADTLIPLPLAKKLFAAAPGPKRFLSIPNAGHNGPFGQQYDDALEDFLASLDSAPAEGHSLESKVSRIPRR